MQNVNDVFFLLEIRRLLPVSDMCYKIKHFQIQGFFGFEKVGRSFDFRYEFAFGFPPRIAPLFFIKILH